MMTVAALFAGCASAQHEQAAPASTAPRATTTTVKRTHRKPRAIHKDPPVPAALFAKSLDIRAGPVPVPLQLVIPSINVATQVLGVGVTKNDVMDAPEGPIHDPVWEEAFWYRGSAIPGVVSTALIAGHIDGPRGTAGVFGDIAKLKAGDLIIVHDTRSALDVRFAVTNVDVVHARPDDPAERAAGDLRRRSGRGHDTAAFEGRPRAPDADDLCRDVPDQSRHTRSPVGGVRDARRLTHRASAYGNAVT